MTTQPDSMTKDEGETLEPTWQDRERANIIRRAMENGDWGLSADAHDWRPDHPFLQAIAAWNRRATPSSADNALREALLVQARQMAERIAQWHPINDSLSVPGAEARTFLAALATSPPAPAQAAEVDERRDRVIMSSVRLGRWLSAALDDPNVCEEMKADIQDWFSAGEPVAGWNAAPVSPTPVEAGALRPDRDVIAYSIIEGSAGIRAAEHAKEFQTANWTDALRSADAVIAALSQPGSSESGGWLPIETAPRDGGRFIGLTKDGRATTMNYREHVKGWKQKKNGGWVADGHHLVLCEEDSDSICPRDATRWMPLPSTPSSKER